MSSGATFAATASVSKDEHWLLYTRSAQWQGDIIMISGF
jgi:hypothetical protein